MATLRIGSFEHVRANPRACARWLSSGAGLWATSVDVVHDNKTVTILDVTFDPPPQLCDYPQERVRVGIRHDGAVFAVPVPTERSWEHRYRPTTIPEILATDQRLNWHHLVGALCLWYPGDPVHLRWTWELGLDGYLRIVQRHVWDEEYYRRNGSWPAEDTPHVPRRDSRPHPVLTDELKRPA